MPSLPHYYSTLAPFKRIFRTGPPLLTYHHVGPQLRGARIKGLYVSARLFARQMAELSAAGFSTPDYNTVGENPKVKNSHLFLTFDDGFCDVLANALPVLRQHKFRAIQFLVANLLGKTSEWQIPPDDAPGALMNRPQIREWLAAGNEIGSHTLTHPWLTRISVSQAREEIFASKKKLEDDFGRAVNHFCYPYGDFNQAVRDLVQEAGYHTACTTRFGVNSQSDDRFALKRITARYPSRNLKAILARLKGLTS